MRDFKPEDFRGCGQYLVRNDKGPNLYESSGLLCTIMYKVGWITNNDNIGNGNQLVALIDMSDGMLRYCHYSNHIESREGGHIKHKPVKEWVKHYWQSPNLENPRFEEAKQIFCNYLNDPGLSQEMRFATHDEVMRVILHEGGRCKG